MPACMHACVLCRVLLKVLSLPSGHQVVKVDVLDEWLEAVALGGTGLGHGARHLERVAVDASN